MGTLEHFVAFVHSWTLSPCYATKTVRLLHFHLTWVGRFSNFSAPGKMIQVCHPRVPTMRQIYGMNPSQTDIQNQAGSAENTDSDDNESDDPIIVFMDLDWENCHPSSCLEPLAADEALPEEERLPPCRTGDNHLYCWGDGEKAHNPKGKMF
ncbi:hypothetical protein CAPTEDRAFT_218694 [Capitella teleta]|uniref:Uncharacterized protein n=1 Tax=Capitella teleta TaxID=283909 RepID=R7VM39_CAPTE|nr:hypothetical protein CAPTEDRAFT_218694 [Capitella teleta]|eukprot:ELU18170.1 hypothetical protein CAPTEDRAFT_218694 [Capitella teleta]